MGTRLFGAAEAARKPCGVRIPGEESSVHTEPVEGQPLKVILAKPSSSIAWGLPVAHEAFQCQAGVNKAGLGMKYLIQKLLRIEGEKQGSEVTLWPLAFKTWDIAWPGLSEASSPETQCVAAKVP